MRFPYTAGIWIVKPGHEPEFVAAWQEFAEWSLTTVGGARWAKLLQDRATPNRFASFGSWDSLEAIEAWRVHPGFAERMARLRDLVETLEPSTLEAVVEIGDGS